MDDKTETDTNTQPPGGRPTRAEYHAEPASEPPVNERLPIKLDASKLPVQRFIDGLTEFLGRCQRRKQKKPIDPERTDR